MVQGPLSYVLRKDVAVPQTATDPLGVNNYFGKSGSLTAELIASLSHEEALFTFDNKTFPDNKMSGGKFASASKK